MRVFQVQTHLSVRISPPDQALVEMRTMRLQDVLAPDRPPPQRHGFDKLNPSQPTSYSYSDNHSGVFKSSWSDPPELGAGGQASASACRIPRAPRA